MLSMREKQVILREEECIVEKEKCVLQKGTLGKQAAFLSTSQN